MQEPDHIPFSPPYIDEEIIHEVTETLRSGWITTGPKVKELEKFVANYTGVSQTLAVNSATSALMLCLHWFGIRKGDEVIIPAYTYCATALAVMHVGATPVMVDVENDFTISPDKIRTAITTKTKAIIAVDFAGWPCAYEEIKEMIGDQEITQKFKSGSDNQKQLGRILLISDAAHALGATYQNKPIGQWADMTVFSLHAVKNVTSAEGGIICLNLSKPFDNEKLYNQLRLWSLNGQTKDALSKSQGGSWRYDIIYPGFKINLPDVLAALALAQLKKYDLYLLRERRRVFNFYYTFFQKNKTFQLPAFDDPDRQSSCHLFPIRVHHFTEEMRAMVIQKMAEKNISLNVHFVPLPMLTVFKNAGFDIAHFPKSYELYCNEISLPVYPQLTDKLCLHICSELCKSVEEIWHDR
ncbi:MAG: DegT/DnrJ/EryC1/StrS family aminotransferase [Bacteroidetes bacterium]|nr:DegT/DnrJ/EryC1/StrS family aminotransferase [Bacteroidota bacterium]